MVSHEFSIDVIVWRYFGALRSDGAAHGAVYLWRHPTIPPMYMHCAVFGLFLVEHICRVAQRSAATFYAPFFHENTGKGLEIQLSPIF